MPSRGQALSADYPVVVGRNRAWLLPAAVVLTSAVFGAGVVVTGYLACGVSGCGGGGFGPTFAPVQTQIGLLATGLCVLPLALLVLRRRRWAQRAAGTVGAVAAGSVLAMVALGLGPNGCPWGQSQATAGSQAFSPGSLTCSGDPNALP